MSNKKNPLYVVTNKGKDVEECDSFLDSLIKRFNLKPMIDILNNILEMILSQVKSYPALVFFNEFMEDFLEKLAKFTPA